MAKAISGKVRQRSLRSGMDRFGMGCQQRGVPSMRVHSDGESCWWHGRAWSGVVRYGMAWPGAVWAANAEGRRFSESPSLCDCKSRFWGFHPEPI